LRPRVLSGIVALVYLGLAIAFGNPELIIYKAVLFLIIPLACIWFSDALGSYTESFSLRRPRINRKTPGIIIAFAGWLLLFIPLVVEIILAMG